MTRQRPNRFPGKCRDCGTHVGANAGLLVGSRGNWNVTCKPGACDPNGSAPTDTGVDAAEEARLTARLAELRAEALAAAGLATEAAA